MGTELLFQKIERLSIAEFALLGLEPCFAVWFILLLMME
jgi:hypothetical protein